MNDNKELLADNADAKLFIRTMSLCFMIIIVDTDIDCKYDNTINVFPCTDNVDH